MKKISSSQIRSFEITAKVVKISLHNKTVLNLDTDECQPNWHQWILENLATRPIQTEAKGMAIREFVSDKIAIRFFDSENTTLIFPKDVSFLGFTIQSHSRLYIDIAQKIIESGFSSYDNT